MLLLSPAAAQAQEHSLKLFLGGGASLPVGQSMGRYRDAGFHVGGGFGLPAGVSARARVALRYDYFPFDQDELFAAAGVPTGTGASAEGGDLSILTVLGVIDHPLAPSSAPVQPYLLTGVGLWYMSISDLIVRGTPLVANSPGLDEAALTLALGTGLRYPISETIGIFLEGQLVWGWNFAVPDLDNIYFPVGFGVALRP